MAEQLDEDDFPDAEDVVIAHLRHELADLWVDPFDVDTVNPERVTREAARVLRVGGTDDGVDDRARMAVVSLAPTRDRARALSRRIRKVMAGDHGVGGLNDAEVAMPDGRTVWVAGCSTDVAPERVPSTNPKIDQDPGYYKVLLPAQ